MNNFTNLFQRTFVGICCSFLLTGLASCVNEIASDVEEGSIPITFTLKIKKMTTRVADNSFEVGDRIGLYAVMAGEDLKGARYIDNLMLTCSGENRLTPERVVFYPEGDASLDFTGYYPYVEKGAAENSSLLPVAIHVDQSDAAAYSASDFMTASKTQVKGTEEAIELAFSHQLTRIKIVLVPGDGQDAEEIMQESPRLVATGFYTQAQYDLESHAFSDFAAADDILPAGQWSVKDGKLEGCEFILLPQVLDGSQTLQMDWNGRIYTCPMPVVDELESNMQYELEINLTEVESQVLNGVVASISEWPDATVLEAVENKDENQALHLSVLSFEASNVYRVHQGGREVAEICKEYLLSDEWATAAITVYPLDENGEADLTQGRVLQLLDVDEDKHGRTLRWDEAGNTFSYEPGQQAPVRTVYFDEAGNVQLEKPAQPASVRVIAHTLRDLRSGLKEYPVAKVGTQYWMRENLKTTCYRDGTGMASLSQLDGTAGYFLVDGTYPLYFYNGEALLAGELSPEGWRIPSLEDWERLENYVQGNAALLKGGPWEPLAGYPQGSPTDEVQPATNETMLDIRASGMWKLNGYDNAKQMVGFWSWDSENNRIPEQTVFFVAQENELVRDQTKSNAGEFYKALSVRCIKE